ncbi:terminase large subunit [Blastochloris tepida]|uniref:Terminase n=1 Tax=Blastochloris tepida TaxID=2233851 RepID=A0A348G1D5_9HYPH|nr:terminase TerL endonuclease subunit [Blastochloris tepida]BBF93368.1 terminase [Blastochloris tepida]
MASPYVFDRRLADAAVEWFARYMRFVDGEWAGKPFVLSPHQVKRTRNIFGWRRRSDGTRRYRRVRIWEPRKNGKTEYMAGLGHLLTIGDNEPGAQVLAHALDAKQSGIVFDKAARMVQLSEELSRLYEVTKTGLFCPALMASFRPLSGEPQGKHGLSPHAALGDEAHEWRNFRLHTFLVQGMGARRQPLDVIISTAGEVNTPGHELYRESKRILEDPAIDPECYVEIFEAPADADWTNPRTWGRANPNLGVSVKSDWMASECKRAQDSPRLENDFRRYHLNQWVEQKTRWLPMQKWPANTTSPKRPTWRELWQAAWGRRAFAGLDLGSTRDITALVWIVELDDGRLALLPRFWVPEDSVAQRVREDRVPYDRWIAEGALQTTPGNVTDYDFIEHAVMADAEQLRCEGLAIDRWNATQVSVHLQSEGLPVKLFGQGFFSMAAPTKELERLFLAGQLEHGDHPVLRWMFGNATVARDPAGNLKPDKAAAGEKIDGVVAAVMGLGLKMGSAPDLTVTGADVMMMV